MYDQHVSIILHSWRQVSAVNRRNCNKILLQNICADEKKINPKFPNLSVMGTMAPLSRIDLPMNEMDHPKPSRTEISNECSCTSTY